MNIFVVLTDLVFEDRSLPLSQIQRHIAYGEHWFVSHDTSERITKKVNLFEGQQICLKILPVRNSFVNRLCLFGVTTINRHLF